VERQSSPTDDDDARLRFARTMAWPRLGRNLSATQGDAMLKQVAEMAKALHQRTDEPAVLLARAITRRSWSSPLMFGCRCRGAAQIACTPSDRQQIGADDVGGCLQ
jgi:hypothetical protein